MSPAFSPGYHCSNFPQRAVKGSCPDLQHEMRPTFRPPHLLTLVKPFADNRLDGTLHNPGGDPLTAASPLGIIGDHARVAADVGLELAGSFA